MLKANLILIGMVFALLFLIQFAYADMVLGTGIIIRIYKNNALLSGQFESGLLSCYGAGGLSPSEVWGNTSSPLLTINQYDSQLHCSWKVAEDNLCKNQSTGNLPPQSGDCFFYGEISTAFTNEFKLAVYIPNENRVYISNPVVQQSPASFFRADLENDGTINLVNVPFLFSPIIPYFYQYAFALCVTLVIEISIGLVLLRKETRLRKVFAAILIANLISVTAIWFGFAQLPIPYTQIILVSEIFAVIFEAIVYSLILKEAFRKFKSALLFSFILNMASFIIGFFITFFISFSLKI